MVLIERRRILHDGGIRDALACGRLTITPQPTDSQFQPSTLDVTIGEVKVYAPRTQPSPSTLERTYQGEFDEPILVPKNSFADIFMREKISYADKNAWPPTYSINHELRSSRGRLHFRSWKHLEEGGREYIRIKNESPNDVLLYGTDPFAQLFFHPNNERESNGFTVNDPDLAEELATLVCNGPYSMEGPLLRFNALDDALQLRDIGVMDTAKKYQEDELYRQVKLSQLAVHERDDLIVKLAPAITLPPHIGIRLLTFGPASTSPFARTAPNVVKAGWVDPGYCGHVTAQPGNEAAAELKADRAAAYGQFYFYTTPVERPYGTPSLGSHYQLDKQFGAQS